MAKVAARPPQPTAADKLTVSKYGLWFPPICDSVSGRPVQSQPDVVIERVVLADYEHLKAIPGQQLLPWREHFKKFITMIWGRKECGRQFIWNPLAERMLDAAVAHKFLGIAGHASSGKSEFGAIWAIASFLIGARGPRNELPDSKFVKVFVTSTTLEESRMRIWGVIESYWQEACTAFGGEKNLPGKLVSSKGKIVHVDITTGKQSNLAGIALIAGGKGQDGDASTKIGFKARKVILVADELPLLTHNLYNTAKTNLFSNDYFQFIGIGNPTSAFDPFGVFIEPKGGWGSITEDYDGWETKLGYCVRFDGEKSPNVIEGRDIYPGILTRPKVEWYREHDGPKSPEYYRMVRGFLCPSGSVNSIFTEQELLASLAMGRVTNWVSLPTKVAFLDPAFTHDGDGAVVAFGLVGDIQDVGGQRKRVLEKTESIDLMMKVDARHQTKEVSEQIADLYIEACRDRGIPIENTGIDATGGGTPFGAIMTMKAGRGYLMVSFAGAPSELRVSPVDKRTGKERFANRVSELCYVGKELNKNGQIKGLDADTMIEMCARTYKNVGEKVLVESKKDMKKRTNGKSPDRADALSGLIEVCRVKFDLSSASKSKEREASRAPSGNRREIPIDVSWGRPRAASFREQQSAVIGASQGGWGE